MIFGLLPRFTFSPGPILRWRLVLKSADWLVNSGGGSHFLDIGCGRGEYVVEIARRYPRLTRCLGMDRMGDDAVGSFLPVPAALRDRVRLIEATLSPEILEHGSLFDAVLCVDVLEHIASDTEFLAELAQVVRPGGRLLLHVPAAGQWHWLQSLNGEHLREIEDGTSEHVREGYTVQRIAAVLSQAGWLVVDVERTFHKGYTSLCDMDASLSRAGVWGRALRAMMLPATLVAAAIAAGLPAREGNGLLVQAVRA